MNILLKSIGILAMLVIPFLIYLSRIIEDFIVFSMLSFIYFLVLLGLIITHYIYGYVHWRNFEVIPSEKESDSILIKYKKLIVLRVMLAVIICIGFATLINVVINIDSIMVVVKVILLLGSCLIGLLVIRNINAEIQKIRTNE